MGKMVQGAAATASAAIYTGGRITTNALSWVQAGVVAGLFVAGAKYLTNEMLQHVNKQTRAEINMVELALMNYIEEMENNLLPKFREAYPDKPQAADYVPIVPGAELTRSFNERIAALTTGTNYTVAYNHMHRINFLARAQMLLPGFQTMLASIARQANQMIDGKLPVDDVGEILVDVAEAAALRGTIGNTHAMTMRRLGVSTLRAQLAGRQALKDGVDLANAMVPIEGELSSRDLIISPENELNMALQQAQLIQQSLQARYNLAAQKAPYLMGELAARLQMIITRLQFDANKANMGTKFVPDYRGMMGQLTGGLMNKVSETFAGAFGDANQSSEVGAEQAGLT